MQYLIWDFDGTLGYRSGMWSGTLLEVLRQEMPECPATVDDMRPYLQDGFPWHRPEQPHTPYTTAEAWWETLLPVFERAFHVGAWLGAREARRLAQHVRAVYVNPHRWQLFDDTLPCLRTLSANGWKHVILSNHVPELPHLMEALGLAPYIVQVFNSAQTGFEKPHPQAFRNVVTALGGATQIWMVGDSVRADIVGAQAVGLRAVLVRSQHPHAAHCCQTLAELPTVLSST
ncbi:MAG: HAD family hydrolase [Candidatus Latescibacteria bacterium]|nr:HAD family hydrolase [Candidatus Latescibacterota bacterium]